VPHFDLQTNKLLQGSAMPAYLVVIQNEPIKDADAFEKYQSLTRELSGGRLTPKVIYGDIVGLEGKIPEGVIILEFPTMEEAQTWYNNRCLSSGTSVPFKSLYIQNVYCRRP
jgi:uncharacterized protein (DUF1330 family)